MTDYVSWPWFVAELQRLERYKQALEAIAYYDDGLIRQYEELGELCTIYENIAKGALI